MITKEQEIKNTLKAKGQLVKIDEEGLQWVYNHIIEACCKLRP